MPGMHSDLDPDGLLEYSVVFTDRSLNHMSSRFQAVMRDISATLREVYGAAAVALVPGGGTFAMEAVARQFGGGQHCLMIRNGWFSYRWSQILEMGAIAASCTVLKAAPVTAGHQAAFAPAAIDEVVASIARERPGVVFAPHVETASGILLPDSYVRALADAVHEVGGLLVLDCIASGSLWVDMEALGVDVLLSAPQKGWSASPCAGLVMLNSRARMQVVEGRSSSFACDLHKWLQIMSAYEEGGHAYHATLPTDSLARFQQSMHEMRELGFEWLRQQQLELGQQVRGLLAQAGYPSVAAEGFEAPGVVVSYTDDPALQSGEKFLRQGLQVAAGVPLQCDEPADYRSFRIGLFGIDKLAHVQRTVDSLARALDSL